MGLNRKLADLAQFIDSSSSGESITKSATGVGTKAVVSSDVQGSAGTFTFTDSSYIANVISPSYITSKTGKATSLTGTKSMFQGSMPDLVPQTTATYDLGDSAKPLAELILDSSANLFFGSEAFTSILSSGTANNVGGGGGSGPAWYGTRAVLGGGYSSSSDTNAIEYFDISNLGNGADFGDISAANRGMGGLSNGSKAVFGGGGSGTFINTMDQITTSTLGNSTDFGDLTVGRMGAMGTGDGTYGLFIGGITSGWSYVNTVDYITVASPGNATDFGDMNKNAQNRAVGSNGTRAVAMCGEHSSSPYHTDDIDYFTIATPGNATDFGNMTAVRAAVIGNLDDGTYACCAGGYNYSTSARVNTIDYITVASAGNATDFGDLLAVDNVGRGVNNGSRGCICGDHSQSNTIQYITISSPGNAQDFGDLHAGRYECGAASGNAS